MKVIVVGPALMSLACMDEVKLAHKLGTPLPHGARYEEFPDPLQQRAATSVPELLTDMANTYRERNKVYGDNWRTVGQVMLALFPNGVHLKTAKAFNTWHLFELIVVKLTRFVNAKLSHADSIHDIAVYAAMLEAIIIEKEKGK